jgi:hypothetical protein
MIVITASPARMGLPWRGREGEDATGNQHGRPYEQQPVVRKGCGARRAPSARLALAVGRFLRHLHVVVAQNLTNLFRQRLVRLTGKARVLDLDFAPLEGVVHR